MNRFFDSVTIVLPDDFHIRIWSVSPIDIAADQKRKTLLYYRQTKRHTDRCHQLVTSGRR